MKTARKPFGKEVLNFGTAKAYFIFAEDTFKSFKSLEIALLTKSTTISWTTILLLSVS